MTVTKLKRFSLKDQEDIQGICDLGVLDPGINPAKKMLMVRADLAVSREASMVG
jgi:hypothetical protein